MVKTPNYNGASNASRIQQQGIKSFTGGLNLSRAPQVEPGETPYCMNVDFPPMGGDVHRRMSIDSPSYSTPTGQYDALIAFDRGSSIQMLYGIRSGSNTLLYEYSTPTTLRHSAAACTPQSITMNDLCYVVLGTGSAPIKWDGSTVTPLSSATFADDATSLPHGVMPKAKCVAVWQQAVWVANIVEPGTSTVYPSRVRWSWPNEPEDWPSWAKEDIDVGNASDQIVALVPHGDRLLVFKTNSIYAIHGNGPDNFRLVPVSSTIGAAGQNAVVRTDDSVYFFDVPNGFYRIGITGGPINLFEKIRKIMDPGYIPTDAYSKISVSWVDRRIYVSVPWSESAQGSSRNGRTFIFDPLDNAWTQHDYGIGKAVRLIHNDTVQVIAPVAHPSTPSYERLGVMNGPNDTDFGSYTIVGTYQTYWFDGGDMALFKRWRRVGTLAANVAQLKVEPRVDYKESAVATFFIEGHPEATGQNLGTAKWGEMVWTPNIDDADYNLIFNDGSRAGTGRVMSVVVSNSTVGDWSLAAVNAKFIPKRRRD